ncbi:hypothetical protein, partial [Cereibacter azotoformans]|uniref:hypothetical protein n=1 Tax=Cereibacter azotoformans TaxID=43057 RepID=UPI00195881D7
FMRQTEIAGFRAESYEILQAMATETSGLSPWINRFAVVQAGLSNAHVLFLLWVPAILYLVSAHKKAPTRVWRRAGASSRAETPYARRAS